MPGDQKGPPSQSLDAPSNETDWWEIFHRTVPDIFGVEDLRGINIGLQYLWRALRNGHRKFKDGRQLDVVYLSLIGVIEFLALFQPVRTEGLSIPLNALESALWALDEGIVEPILKPVRPAPTGRAKESELRQEFVGMVVYVAHRLRDFGFSAAKAEKIVAEDLRAVGVKTARGGRPVSWRTVKLWGEKVSQDVGCKGTSARRFRALMADSRNEALDSAPPLEAAQLLRSRLRVSAREFGQIFPPKPAS
jgi:hypothetical protein